MTNLAGPIADLTKKVIPFNAVHTTTAGATNHGHFVLSAATGLHGLLLGRAVASLSDTLTAEIAGPAAANKATTLTLALVPSNLTTWPTTAEQVRALGGSTRLKDSLYTLPQARPVNLSIGTSRTLIADTQYGHPPAVVYHYIITGGVATDTVEISISGTIDLEGVGFVPTW